MFKFRYFNSLLFCLFVHIVCFAQPANDKIENAEVILPSDTPNPSNGDLTNATVSVVNTSPSSTPTNIDVWYKFKPSATTQYLTIDSGTGGIQVNFDLYSGTGLPLVLTKITALSISNNSTTSITNKLLSGLDTNLTYYFRVFHKTNPISSSFSQTFTTYIIAPPSNDQCKGAIKLFPSKICSPTDGDLNFSTKTTPAPSPKITHVVRS